MQWSRSEKCTRQNTKCTFTIIVWSTPENSALGFSGAKMLSMPPYVMKQLNNTNWMRDFGPSNVFHNFSTMHPKPTIPMGELCDN